MEGWFGQKTKTPIFDQNRLGQATQNLAKVGQFFFLAEVGLAKVGISPSFLTPVVVKGATIFHVTKNKLSSLYNCVRLCFVSVLSGKNSKRTVFQFCTKITPGPLLSETAKRQNWFLNCTRVEKHSNCTSFWKFVCHQSSSVVLESCSTCCVDSRIRQRYLLSWIRDWTGVKLCATVKKHTRHPLVSLRMTRN